MSRKKSGSLDRREFLAVVGTGAIAAAATPLGCQKDGTTGGAEDATVKEMDDVGEPALDMVVENSDSGGSDLATPEPDAARPRTDAPTEDALADAGEPADVEPDVEDIEDVPDVEPEAEVSPPGAGKAVVVRVTKPGVVSWDGEETAYWESVDAIALAQLLDAGLKALTGAGSANAAWAKLLVGYEPGHVVAIKPNLNNGTSGSENLNPLPQTLVALVGSLVEFGVPAKDIRIYEAASARGFSKSLADALLDAFPELSLLNPPGEAKPAWGIGETSFGTGDPDEVIPYTGSTVTSVVAACVVECEHLINVPILRSHFGGGATLITGALKNHYGSINYRRHDFQTETQNPIAEVNLNPHFQSKTRLILMEAIFGRYSGGPWGGPQVWKTAPGGTPASLMLATDPVAIDSVGVDMLLAELEAQGLEPCQHATQHAAETLGLGVHDHASGDAGYEKLALLELVI